MSSAVNTPEGLGESAPLLAPDARRRKSYLAPSSARNAIAATLVSGCVVAVLAVSGRYGSSPVVHVERPGLARMATLSDAPKQPAPNVRAALKKSRVEQPTRTAPKADIAAAAHAKRSNGESELAGGNIFTRTFDALDVLNVIPDATPHDSSGPAPGPEPWDWFAMAPGPGSFEDFYPGTSGCEARCEGVDINEEMCNAMPFCEWDTGLCWSGVGPAPCPDEVAFGPAMAPEPAPGPEMVPDPRMRPDPRDPRERPDSRMRPDPRDPRANPRSRPDPRDPRADPRAHPDPRDPRADPRARPDPRDPRDPRADPRARPDPRDPRDPRADPRARPDPRDPRVPPTPGIQGSPRPQGPQGRPWARVCSRS